MNNFTASSAAGLLRLHWTPGTFITYEMAVKAARALEKLSDGQRMPLLVNASGVAGLDAEARAGMNAYRGFSIIALLGDDPMGTVVTAFARQSSTPTRYFLDEKDALNWLAQHKAHEKVASGKRKTGKTSGPGTE